MSVDEVIAMIPADYCHILRDPLLGIASNATRLAAAETTLANWEGHKVGGTYPPHLHQKAPNVQFTKGYKESDEGLTALAAFTKLHTTYMASALDLSIHVKWDKVGFLKRALTDELVAKSKLPVFEKNVEGALCHNGYKENPTTAALSLEVQIVSYVWDHAAQAKKEQKKVIHAEADIEMADASKPGPSIQSISIAAHLKKLDKPSKGKDGKKSVSSSSTKKETLPYVPSCTVHHMMQRRRTQKQRL
ncbi:hypothetical protein BV22DRAFT_1134405 [Leucogyrophana mollusca]|uniref:Uncharacterized protein n=1 Tax=Leucogyrophana mollusca TaxID=85980 RepID=A0ACB8AZF9_9AGAM|nr:hypothetical protein BV22DRAFT_1134405 [Leucogyrophana mollusca]